MAVDDSQAEADSQVDEFAELFRRFLHRMAGPGAGGDTLAARLADHLGVDPTGLSAVSEVFDSWEHANVQAALDAYLAQPGYTAELVGVPGGHMRGFGVGFSELVATSAPSVGGPPTGGTRPGPVDFVNVPVGPGRVRACIEFGVAMVGGPTGPLAVLVRTADERSGPMGARVTVEVMAPEPGAAEAFLADLRHLTVQHNVYRGQVVSLARRQPGFGTIVAEFHPRPDVDRSAIVLADGVLDRIEAHVVGIGDQAARLVAAGRHLKRGLLLHGPPGTGKTLSVRYLTARRADATVFVLSGPALGLIGPTCALARSLTPAVVVLEDVDLVAAERTMPGTGRSPLMFELLNEMEGMADDADVTFLMTTNRPDLLEPALAARPGRIDLAVEIGLPDEGGRRRLFELYGAGLDLAPGGLDDLVARTDGVSPAFIKELLRKAALVAAGEAADGRLGVTVGHVDAALDELLGETSSLTRLLLGGATDRPPPSTLASMGWLPAAAAVGPEPGHR